VLDIDPRHGGDASLTSLIEQYGALPETLEARTGGGGHHIIFEYPRGSNIRNSAGRLGDGIDVRAEGGYIVVAPSLHASGRRYEWLNSLTKPAQPPEWLLERLTEERQASQGASTQKTQPRAAVGASIGAVISEGERNNGLFKIGAALRGQGQNYTEIEAELRDINARRCSPPLPDDEVQKIAGSCAKLAANRVAVGA
jgi:putative DNA primase/helicase